MLRTTFASSRALRICALGLVTITTAILISSESAEARRAKQRRHHVVRESYSPQFSSIIVDANSGAVLSSNNPDGIRRPASLTKVMTLYLLFERLESGKLKLDTVRFNAALQDNPGAVSDIFTSGNGVAVKLADLMGAKTSIQGELTVRSSNITDSLVDLKDQQDALEARMKVIEQRYLRQFNALDALLAQMNTTANSLDSWLARENKD